MPRKKEIEDATVLQIKIAREKYEKLKVKAKEKALTLSKYCRPIIEKEADR